MDLEKVIKENQAKAAAKNKKKIEKKGVAGEQIANAAKVNTVISSTNPWQTKQLPSATRTPHRIQVKNTKKEAWLPKQIL